MIYSERSYSKINIFLDIEGIRKDGYHNIKTIFVPLNCPSDDITVEFTSSGGFNIHCTHPDVPIREKEKNICYKAAELFMKILKHSCNIKELNCNLTINKNIPVAAGMGGGSSNAAVFLKILQRYYDGVSDKQVFEIAKYIGADVPFFLSPQPCIAEGIGDIITPLNIINGNSDPVKPVQKKLFFVVASPNFPVSTQWAYQQADLMIKEKKLKSLSVSQPERFERLVEAFIKLNSAEYANFIYNIFEEILYGKFPILNILKKEFISFGALNVGISGSGPAMFAVCNSSQHALKIKQNMDKRFSPPCDFYVSEMLTPTAYDTCFHKHKILSDINKESEECQE